MSTENNENLDDDIDVDKFINELTNKDQYNVELDFISYITSLGYQALIFLGEAPNPMTNETEKNLKQAKFLLDTLIIIQEKTKEFTKAHITKDCIDAVLSKLESKSKG